MERAHLGFTIIKALLSAAVGYGYLSFIKSALAQTPERKKWVILALACFAGILLTLFLAAWIAY